jgi:chloramphenicol O-acetyltransferase
MKGIIKQYRPAYFSGYENKTNSFNSLDELLNIDWVKSFSEYKDFFRFSIEIADEREKNHTLLGEYKNGQSWYVIGFIPKENSIVSNELAIFDKE